MSNQINQREEDKKRLFGKTPDTQPEPIQEEEAGAAAADPEHDPDDPVTLEESLDYFKDPENTMAFMDELKTRTQEGESQLDYLLDLVKLAEEIVTKNKTREEVSAAVNYILLLGTYIALTNQIQGEVIETVTRKAPDEGEIEARLIPLIGQENLNKIIAMQENYPISDPPTVAEVFSRMVAVHMFTITIGKTPAISKPKKVEKIVFPLDKLNSTRGKLWGLFDTDTSGQLTLDLSAANDQREINLIYSVDFSALDGLHVRKELLDYDKRVYLAISALYDEGNRIITATQIYYAMGNTKRPNSREIEKILRSVRKMIALPITLDNSAEAEVYKYPKFEYYANLLPAEMGVIVNVAGTQTANAIRLFRDPPVTAFAKSRNQITTLPIQLLQAPVSHTDQAIAHEDYLINRISAAIRRNQKSLSILIETLQEKANLNEKKARTKERSERFLTHYKEQRWIKDYTISKDKIIITLSDEDKKGKK